MNLFKGQNLREFTERFKNGWRLHWILSLF